MSLAPVILFVYNRPNHTLQTLEALKANTLADQSVLYIFADGAKKGFRNKELHAINQVRSIIKSKQWCKSVVIEESAFNKGLADSIIGGVTKVIEKHARAIILEDDIVTSKGFLQYMNEALDLYSDEDQVMHVSGYMFPVKSKLPETFFYNTCSCWGWGTWKRAWKHLNMDVRFIKKELECKNQVHQFNVEDTNPFTSQLDENLSGKIKTWGIRWYGSVFLKNGLCLHPGSSLVQNIGNDGTGVHCAEDDVYWHSKLADYVTVKPILLKESPEARAAMQAFYQRLNHWTFWEKVKRKLKFLRKKVGFSLTK